MHDRGRVCDGARPPQVVADLRNELQTLKASLAVAPMPSLHGAPSQPRCARPAVTPLSTGDAHSRSMVASDDEDGGQADHVPFPRQNSVVEIAQTNEVLAVVDADAAVVAAWRWRADRLRPRSLSQLVDQIVNNFQERMQDRRSLMELETQVRCGRGEAGLAGASMRCGVGR